MDRSDQDRLLKEILAGDELAGFRQESLESGLTQLRKLRQRRRALRICVLALMPLLAFAVGRFLLPSKPSNASKEAPALAGSRSVELINDDQLLALFPNRSVALIGSPGHQQLVFLDQIADGRVPPENGASAIQ